MQDMSDEFDKFSYTLDKKHLDAALSLKATLLAKENTDHNKLAKYHVYSKSLFEKGFQFADIQHNQDSADVLETFEIAEKNLNRDLASNDTPSKKLIANYMKVAADTKKKLKAKFGEAWSEPNESQLDAKR